MFQRLKHGTFQESHNMNLFHSILEYRDWRNGHADVAFVPTMGNLHEGHLRLVRLAKTYAKSVVVSIFVNPLQFGPHEDFDNYPRTLSEDMQKLEKVNTDVIFAPSVMEMYPSGSAAQTQVMVPEISKGLCGESRPHFFQGVATVVCKLFNCVQPTVAIFGEKDYQQLLVIKKMVQDLNLPIEIIGAPIVREVNGLAMSSRNQYLSQKQKEQASLIYQSLQSAAQAIHAGGPIETILTHEKQKLNTAGFKLDYYELRDTLELKPLTSYIKPARLFVAAYLGKTRLIDNLSL